MGRRFGGVDLVIGLHRSEIITQFYSVLVSFTQMSTRERKFRTPNPKSRRGVNFKVPKPLKITLCYGGNNGKSRASRRQNCRWLVSLFVFFWASAVDRAGLHYRGNGSVKFRGAWATDLASAA